MTFLLACSCGLAGRLAAQAAPSSLADSSSAHFNNVPQMPTLSCPGSFPTDFTVQTCSYTMSQRAHDFVIGSVTDLPFVEAVVTASIAQAKPSPGEWKGNWGNFGKRIGVRYNQSVAKGAAVFLVGAIDHEDPRHVSFHNDPNLKAGASPTVMHRIGHAFLDSVSDRISQPDGKGRRWPAISRFVGAYASGYGGYAWYPGPENTFKNASLRAAQSIGTDVANSFFTEFSPDLTKGLAWLVKSRSKPKAQGIEE